uniref:F-box domain-containing protein n=1 Tax=Rhabditophanes sp. KR3021 TaxID=114890 RepID=A0AC35UA39_9BILA
LGIAYSFNSRDDSSLSKGWNIHAMDGSNWMRIDLFRFQKDIRTSVLERLANNCGNFLRELNLKGCINISDLALKTFATRCHNIQKLSLSGCKRISDVTCEYLGRNCKSLSVLDFENCTTITEKGLMHISDGCSYLEEINLNWCNTILDRGLFHLLSKCKHLRILLLKGCSSLTDQLFSTLPKQTYPLTHLNMMNCFVSQFTIEDISCRFKHLKFLNISNNSQLLDNSFLVLSENCRDLINLELSGCSQLSDNGLFYISKFCPKLKKLDLEDCTLLTDSSLFMISKNCEEIEHIILSHLENVTNDGIEAICKTFANTLQIIELDNMPEITNQIFSHLDRVTTLKKAVLFDCQLITKAAIKDFESNHEDIEIQSYFAPPTPVIATPQTTRGICKCCVIL